MVSRSRLGIFIVIVLMLIAGLIFLLTRSSGKSPLLVPTSLVPQSELSPDSPRQAIGFVPYWNLTRLNEESLETLTTVYYFAISASKSGHFDTKDNGWRNLSSPNFLKLKSLTRANNQTFGVTVAVLNAETLSTILKDPAAQRTLISNTAQLLTDHNFTALNIDFEYSGLADPSLRQPLTNFVKEFSESLRSSHSDLVISFDGYADLPIRPRIYDLKAISESVDQIVIMGYDFYKTNSLRAGPVAPLNGRETHGYDIASSVIGYQASVPVSKLVLAIPLYGYEWPVESPEKNARVIKSPRSPEVSSLRRSLETSATLSQEINFDDQTKSPWFSYFDTDSDTYRQVWFENEVSIAHKIDFVTAQNLAGIAFFALGYEGDNSELIWDRVNLYKNLSAPSN